jgi:twitching motility two-component system response regulator PilG
MADAPKVLVIDDDADFQASVRCVLEDHGYSVFEAYSGKEGLSKLVEHDPDVIVLDIIMDTGSEGYIVNAAIRYQDEYARHRDIPIIMVSSIQASPDELYPRAVEVSMIRPSRYLTKPLDILGFLEAVEKAVEGHSRPTH